MVATAHSFDSKTGGRYPAEYWKQVADAYCAAWKKSQDPTKAVALKVRHSTTPNSVSVTVFSAGRPGPKRWRPTVCLPSVPPSRCSWGATIARRSAPAARALSSDPGQGQPTVNQAACAMRSRTEQANCSPGYGLVATACADHPTVAPGATLLS